MADAVRRGAPVSCIAIGPTVSRVHGPAEELPVPTRIVADIGRTVAKLARGSDVVGRMGASEFAILAPMTESSGAMELVERLRDKVAGMPPLVADGSPSRVALRAGVATLGGSGLELRDGTDLLVRASTALRFAQSSRTSGIRTFDEVPASFV